MNKVINLLSCKSNWVYIISRKNYGFPIKIGRTIKLKNRFSQIQTSSFFPIELKFAIECGSKEKAIWIEKNMHNHFNDRKSSKEWFNIYYYEACHPLIQIWNCAHALTYKNKNKFINNIDIRYHTEMLTWKIILEEEKEPYIIPLSDRPYCLYIHNKKVGQFSSFEEAKEFAWEIENSWTKYYTAKKKEKIK